jgi:hypothetical protein
MTSYNNPTEEDVRLQDRHNRGLEIDDAKGRSLTNALMCTVTQSVRPYLALICVAICIHAHVMIITMVTFVNIYIRFILSAEL